MKSKDMRLFFFSPLANVLDTDASNTKTQKQLELNIFQNSGVKVEKKIISR